MPKLHPHSAPGPGAEDPPASAPPPPEPGAPGSGSGAPRERKVAFDTDLGLPVLPRPGRGGGNGDGDGDGGGPGRGGGYRGGGGPTPAYPILTEELGYPPSPLANGNGSGGSTRSGSLGPVVTKALQDVLGWKVKKGDAAGFVGALNQSFQLTTFEGAVVSAWTPRSYIVQSDLSAPGVTGAQASIYTMAKTLLDQTLPLIDGLYPLDPASNIEDVAAIKDVVTSQLNNLTAEIGYLGGPRVMRVHQYFERLLGITLSLNFTEPLTLQVEAETLPPGSPLNRTYPGWEASASDAPPYYWKNPDLTLGSLGDLRDQLGVSEFSRMNFVNTMDDERDATNFRIIIDYVNALFESWRSNIRFFAEPSSRFLGTELVYISRQLGVIAEAVSEVRFVLELGVHRSGAAANPADHIQQPAADHAAAHSSACADLPRGFAAMDV